MILYRRDIDGLRALAVLPVVLFHADMTFFGGGFVGVDVFFVVSGFLITSIIHREHKLGEFSLLRFYERRARRIILALPYLVSRFFGTRVGATLFRGAALPVADTRDWLGLERVADSARGEQPKRMVRLHS